MKRASSLNNGFTLIELLTVMTIIGLLSALVLVGASFATKQGAQKRTEAEIQGLSAACESYKVDNGDYPRDNNTDNLDPKTNSDSTSSAYKLASLALYKALSGDANADGFGGDSVNGQKQKVYYEFTPNNRYPKSGTVQYLADPFRKGAVPQSYGYSTKYNADLAANPGNTPTGGYNPTFDLWSTGDPDTRNTAGQNKWIKNW